MKKYLILLTIFAYIAPVLCSGSSGGDLVPDSLQQEANRLKFELDAVQRSKAKLAQQEKTIQEKLEALSNGGKKPAIISRGSSRFDADW